MSEEGREEGREGPSSTSTARLLMSSFHLSNMMCMGFEVWSVSTTFDILLLLLLHTLFSHFPRSLFGVACQEYIIGDSLSGADLHEAGVMANYGVDDLDTYILQ